MKFLSSERLSQHKYKTPEGYLICTDAILARTGKQTYRKNEVFADSDDDSEIEVDRTYEEVFSPETLASFENKPITWDHPEEDVNAENYNELSVGFVRDVHEGQFNGEPVIMGTLVITDARAIDAIENGDHLQLSCGYDCDIADEQNPQQRNIRGNHIALCEQGRAGIARIVDSVNDSYYLKDKKEVKIKELKKGDVCIDPHYKDKYKIIEIESDGYYRVKSLNSGLGFVVTPNKTVIVDSTKDAKETFYVKIDTKTGSKIIYTTQNENDAYNYRDKYRKSHPDEFIYVESNWDQRNYVDSVKDSFVIALTANPDTWMGRNGPTKIFEEARKFNSYEEADRVRRQYGKGSVSRINDSDSEMDYITSHKEATKMFNELINVEDIEPEKAKRIVYKYFNKDIKDAEELPHISKEKWNKIPKDYKHVDPVTGKKQAFAGSLGIAPGGTTLLTEGKHFAIDSAMRDIKYGITTKKKWDSGNHKAEKVFNSLSEAKYVANKSEMVDGQSYVVIDIETSKLVDSLKKYEISYVKDNVTHIEIVKATSLRNALSKRRK